MYKMFNKHVLNFPLAHEYEKVFDEYQHDGYEATPPPPPIDEVSPSTCDTTGKHTINYFNILK